MNNRNYLVVENAPDVCEGIIRRMAAFPQWKSIGYCTGVKEAIATVLTEYPSLLFLDWGLNGGSAYDVLQAIQNEKEYDPYIIFNTGFQKDNPEIPQEIINRYRVDKYLIKPLWENLRLHLPTYLKEAEEKASRQLPKPKKIWIEDITRTKVPLPLDRLVCVCQHPTRPRCRMFYTSDRTDEITAELSWQQCMNLLEANGIDFFVTKSRSHIVIRDFIEAFDKPFVRLRHFPAKIEVVKESIREFESWLTRTDP